jgi:hypothetical protein
VKAGVKDNGLAGDGAVPANDDQGDIGIDCSRVNVQPLEEEADGVRHDAPSRNAEAPEVKPDTPFEGGKDDDSELYNIVKGDGDKGDNGINVAGIGAGTGTIIRHAGRDPCGSLWWLERHEVKVCPSPLVDTERYL